MKSIPWDSYGITSAQEKFEGEGVIFMKSIEIDALQVKQYKCISSIKEEIKG